MRRKNTNRVVAGYYVKVNSSEAVLNVELKRAATSSRLRKERYAEPLPVSAPSLRRGVKNGNSVTMQSGLPLPSNAVERKTQPLLIPRSSDARRLIDPC